MARDLNSKKGMTDGLFSTKKDMERPQALETTPEQKAPVQEKKSGLSSETKQEIRKAKEVFKKVGRPRDGDLQDGEETKPTTIQFTDATIYKLDAYLLDNKPKTRSQVIRELIRKYL